MDTTMNKEINKNRPSRMEVIDAIATTIDRADSIRAIIAHGSWVREDFWPGQSDLDLIVIGVGGTVPQQVRPSLQGLKGRLGTPVEPWETSEHFLARTRAE